MRNRRKTVVAAATALTLVCANIALADDLIADGDGLLPVVESELDFGGDLCVDEESSRVALLAISRGGNYQNASNVFLKGSTVTVSVQSTTGGVTAEMVSSTIDLPSDWDASNSGISAPATADVSVAPAVTGNVEGTVTFQATGLRVDGTTPLTRTATLSVVGAAQDCSPTDTTPPDVSISLNPVEPDGENGWYTSAVKVTISATDEDDGSGVNEESVEYTVDDGVTWVAYTSPLPFSADGNHEVQARAEDKAGNEGSAGPVPFKIDQTAPVVDVTGVTDGATYTLGEVPAAGCETTDPTSGVAQYATIASPPDNSTVGTKAVQCTGAKDNAGNTGSSSVVTYSVHYAFDGFFRPVDNDGVNVVRMGQAVPLKFSLAGDHGLGVISKVKAVTYACDAPRESVEITDAATPGQSELSYDADADQYVYVWKTAKKWDGNCALLAMQLNDGSWHFLKFQGR
jgi:hypothetical protein